MTSYPVNMPPHATRAEATRFLHFTLGIWLGVYAFRSFVPTAVWNLSDTLPLALKGGLAIGIHVAGLLGAWLPITRRKNAVASLAGVLGTTGILRQIFIGHDILGSAFSLAGWILWLWWLVAIARYVNSSEARLLVAAFASALSLQAGMQVVWHGLDLPMARGSLAVTCAVLLNIAFAASAYASGDRTAHATPSTRVFIAIGIALFMELTLFGNVGRISQITGFGLLASALLIQGGLLLGTLSTLTLRRPVQTAAIVLVLIAGITASAGRAGGALLLFGQAATIALLFSSATRQYRSAVAAFSIGMIALFVLVFLFYNWYELPVLWAVSAIALALCALPVDKGAPMARAYSLAPACGIALALFSAIPFSPDEETAKSADRVRVLSYNIHQGYDAFGVPAMQRIADEIAVHDADIVALQEVGRGWTFVGGADLVAYLRFRFPDYRVHFVPVNGQLWGVALMTRLPVASLSGSAFKAPPHTFRYGFAAGTVSIGALRVRVISVHLTAGLEGNGADGRLDQIEQLLHAVAESDNVIIAGDLNTHPHEPPVQRIASAGFVDAGGAARIAARPTWPAHAPNERIDYVFTRGALKAIAGDVRRTNASDHLPVVIELLAAER